MKKSLLIIIGVVLAVGIIAIGYFLRSRGTPGTEDATGTLPGVTTGNNNPRPQGTENSGTVASVARALSDGPVLDYVVDQSNALLFIAPDGKIGQSLGGKTTVINSSPIQNLESALFSPDGKKILVVIRNGINFSLSIFDIETKTWRALPINSNRVAWSPLSNEISYLTDQNGKNVLSALNINSKDAKARTLVAVRGYDLELSWPALNQLIISQKPSSFTASDLWTYDIAKKTLTPIIRERLGATVLFDKEAKNGLFFSADTSNQGGTLRLIEPNGATREEFAFLTLPQKCAFSFRNQGASSTPTSVLYCAIPRDAKKFSLAALPDDYLKRAIFGVDNLYLISLENGSIVELFNDQNSSFDMTHIKVFEGKVFFENRFDGRIYGIETVNF